MPYCRTIYVMFFAVSPLNNDDMINIISHSPAHVLRLNSVNDYDMFEENNCRVSFYLLTVHLVNFVEALWKIMVPHGGFSE